MAETADVKRSRFAEARSTMKTTWQRLIAWSRRNRLRLFTFLLIIALIGIACWMLVAGISAYSGPDGFAATAIVGDTFGGTLGPILSFAALMATVILALWVRPKQEDEEKAELRQEKERDKAELRAEKVVAWLAETYTRAGDEAELMDGATSEANRSRVLGAVVSNASGSVVFNMDLIIEPTRAAAVAADQPLECSDDLSTMDFNVVTKILPEQDLSVSSDVPLVKINREALVPPGTWFLPLEAEDDSLGWQLPVPVEATGVPTVKLEDSASATSSSDSKERIVRAYSLRPHLPEANKKHYVVTEIRYDLHGENWKRDQHGKVKRALPWSQATTTMFEKAKTANRTQVTGPRTKHDIYEILRQTMAEVSENANAYLKTYALFPATGEYLRGVKSISRNRATGIYLHLTDMRSGPIIRIAGNKHGVYPDVIEYYDAFNADRQPSSPVDLNTEVSNTLMEIKQLECGGDSPKVDQWLDRNGELTSKWQNFLNRLVAATPAAQP